MMENLFVCTSFFLDASTLPVYLLFHQFQNQAGRARQAAPRDANWQGDAERQTKPAKPHAVRRSRRKRTPQQISEINRANALRRWAKSHAANPHASRARVISSCIESEVEVEKEKPADLILNAPAPGQGHHHRHKHRTKRQRKTWTGDNSLKRAQGAEATVMQRLGERAWLYSHCKTEFLSRRQGLYFWDHTAAFAVHQFLERHCSATQTQIDDALDACFAEGVRLSAKAVFDNLDRDSEKTYKRQIHREYQRIEAGKPEPDSYYESPEYIAQCNESYERAVRDAAAQGYIAS